MDDKYSNKFSQDLINILKTLLNENYKKRPNPHDLIKLAIMAQNNKKQI
jgi:hypothetical protein